MDVQYENRSITLYGGPEKKIAYSTHMRCPQMELDGQDVQLWPAKNYVFEVNNRNTGKICEICSKLTIKRRLSSVFTFNFEHISHFLLLLFIVDFEPVNVSLEMQTLSWAFLWKDLSPLNPRLLWGDVINADLRKINLSIEMAGDRSK